MKNSCGSREKSEVHDMPETPLITIYRVVTIAKNKGKLLTSYYKNRIAFVYQNRHSERLLRTVNAALDDRRRENGKNKKLLLCSMESYYYILNGLVAAPTKWEEEGHSKDILMTKAMTMS